MFETLFLAAAIWLSAAFMLANQQLRVLFGH
jgi:hypothetical protein